MGLLRRSRRDDVDVDSFLANLHRIADVATAPIRRIIDLRWPEDADEASGSEEADVGSDAPTRR